MSKKSFVSPWLFLKCQEQARQESREFDETLKQFEEDEKSKISNIQLNYERKLRGERETNTNLKGEAGVLTQKVTKRKDLHSSVPVYIPPFHH